MKAENEAIEERWEEDLRAAAPALPPALRGRTLARCADETESRGVKRRGRGFFKWAFVGVCVVHWATGALLDSQRATLMAGAAVTPASAPAFAEGGDSSGGLRGNLQARSRVMMALMSNQDGWSANPESG